MITQDLFNKKPKTFMDYEPGKVPGKNEWTSQATTRTQPQNAFASNVKIVGDNVTEKDYDEFFKGFNSADDNPLWQEKQVQENPRINKLPYNPTITGQAKIRNLPYRPLVDGEPKIQKLPYRPMGDGGAKISFYSAATPTYTQAKNTSQRPEETLWEKLNEPKQPQSKAQNQDAIEFGEDSETYKILQDLSKRWYATSDSAEKDRLHEVAEEVRRLARGNNRVKYGTDEIFDVMHKNAKLGQLVNAGSLGTIPIKATLTNPLLAGVSGGLLEPSAFLTAMTDYGPWDYKYNDYWRVGGDEEEKGREKLEYFDGKDLDADNNRNWLPWIYFDGYLIGADKFGNMNMAYVGKKMGLPEKVYKNFTTMDDPEDIFWIDKGINYANSGR